jgi:hypothetical protein
MKPNRVRMTHSLVVGYDLYRRMEVVRPYHVPADFMKQFHSSDYIDFLGRINVDNVKKSFLEEQQRFRVNAEIDCPVFDGLFEYCQTYTGGSVGGAYKLITGASDIAINWAGGLHHAKKSEASGFCYVNDIVLAILELLKKVCVCVCACVFIVYEHVCVSCMCVCVCVDHSAVRPSAVHRHRRAPRRRCRGGVLHVRPRDDAVVPQARGLLPGHGRAGGLRGGPRHGLQSELSHGLGDRR